MAYLDVHQKLGYTARTLFDFRAEIGIRDFQISDNVCLLSFNVKDNDARELRACGLLDVYPMCRHTTLQRDFLMQHNALTYDLHNNRAVTRLA